MSELELEDIQGLVAYGYGKLPYASLLLLGFAGVRRARGWLAALTPGVTGAAGPTPEDEARNVAFTAGGLERLGLGETAALGFSSEFRGGMTAPHRRRVLGDEGERAPERWGWGGPTTPRIDAVLLLYAASERALAELEASERTRLQAHRVTVVRRLDTAPLSDREHFGFRDGISQPAIRELGSPDPQAVAAGEFVLGYENEYGLFTDRPLLSAEDDPGGRLPLDPQGSGRPDLGRNGSYLVLRQLSQDVPRFWRFAERAANGDGDAREALAARLVGRWPSGAPLVLAPDSDDAGLGASRGGEANAFDYAHMDPDGRRCPLGAHIRRANPRDSLDPDPGSEASLRINRRHRLVRRGRAYGTPIAQEDALREAEGGGDPRGLHFACLCGNLARQYEFVQHTWINNPKFHQLYEDPDPLIGPPGGTLTIQASPVRRRLTGLPEFVSVRGGAYFFLPGRRALAFLARGPG